MEQLLFYHGIREGQFWLVGITFIFYHDYKCFVFVESLHMWWCLGWGKELIIKLLTVPPT